MIKNRLSVLLAERNLKISKVFKDTGISRSTLNNIAKNETDMIRLETINTLCKYLNVTPGDFFDYVPVDLNFTVVFHDYKFETFYEVEEIGPNKIVITFSNIKTDLFLDVSTRLENTTYDLKISLDNKVTVPIDVLINSQVSADFELKVDFVDNNQKKYFITNFFEELLDNFHLEIYRDFQNTIIDSFVHYFRKNVFPNIFSKHLDITDENQISSLLNNIDLKFKVFSDVFLPF